MEELNEINPQIASRVMAPLTRWRKYDEGRQHMMKRELTRILEIESLSSDVCKLLRKAFSQDLVLFRVCRLYVAEYLFLLLMMASSFNSFDPSQARSTSAE